MSRCLRMLLLAATFCGLARAGDIEGQVSAQGRELPGGAKAGKYDSRKALFFERMDYASMHDFVVWLETTNAVSFPKPTEPVRIVVQKDAMFHPHVLPIVVGTEVEWPNEDDIFHNVFSFSDPKPFDLGLYKDEVKKVTFDKPGRVDIFCSIHKNMSCTILVLANPWFAATDARGRYAVRNIPAGTYTLKAWHERLPPQMREIVVTATGTNRQDFVLGVKDLPKL